MDSSPTKRKISSNDEDPSVSKSKKRNIVDFLIIGVQKGGTMSVLKNLNKHPEIYVAPKECHFFDLYWDMGLNWYKAAFQTSKLIRGEKTPELIYVDACAPRIKEVCPHAKFILFLRDPVKRAYSGWNMEISRGLEELPFDECVEREITTMMGQMRSYGTSQYHFIQRGFYYDQIIRFRKTFPDKNQMLIIIAERLRSQPTEEYRKIFEFLGASNVPIVAEEDHIGSYTDPLSKRMEAKLRKLFQPHNEKLFKYLGYRIPEWEGAPAPIAVTAPMPADKPVVTSSAPATSVSTSSTTNLTDSADKAKDQVYPAAGTARQGESNVQESSGQTTVCTISESPFDTSS